MTNAGTRGDVGVRFGNRILWATLLPLLLMLRPYEGLDQDARIYIGRGVADRDPLGVGRDLMFAADGQTGFTALRPLIRALLGVLAPTEISLVLALVGSLVWLGAVVVLCRSLARGRAGWAAAVCVLALPPDYGGFGTFIYGETVLTPRVFAEAAVIGALAGLLGGRRLVAFLLLGVALALHPLMALPGLAIAAVMLAWEDRRWLVPIGGAVIAVLAAAALKLPMVDRLFEPMDAVWLDILRSRSVNLFPSLWEIDVYARVAGRVAAVVVAATVVPPRVRVLLLAALGVGAGGLALAALFGDRFPLVLVAQLQTWRALWPLALLGNASIALAAVGLWRRGPAARLTLAVLILSYLSASTAPLAIGLAAAAIGLRFADCRGALAGVSSRVGRIAVALVLGAAALDVVMGVFTIVVYLRSAADQGGEVIYAHLLMSAVQRWPIVLGALALALGATGGAAAVGPSRLRSATAGPWAAAGLVAACLAAASLWNSGGSEQRMIDAAGAQTAELRRLIGPAPGSVLWVDDFNESWFLAGRAAYFNSTQGCPILFSRSLAIDWQERGRMLARQGLARRSNLTPWTGATDRDDALVATRASVEAVCRMPDHPAAIVAPGRTLDAAPPGWPAGLWQPPIPVERMGGDDGSLRWNKTDIFTVIQCRPADSAAPPA